MTKFIKKNCDIFHNKVNIKELITYSQKYSKVLLEFNTSREGDGGPKLYFGTDDSAVKALYLGF